MTEQPQDPAAEPELNPDQSTPTAVESQAGGESQTSTTASQTDTAAGAAEPNIVSDETTAVPQSEASVTTPPPPPPFAAPQSEMPVTTPPPPPPPPSAAASANPVPQAPVTGDGWTSPAGAPGTAMPPSPINAMAYADPYAKSKVLAGILGILLGGLGIHRFYLGYTTIGIIQIAVTILTCGIGSLWGFVEGILILIGAKGFTTDATGRPLRD